MAFKKTGGRKAYVSPSGMPDLSGFKNSAKAFEGLADLAYGIGLDERKREYNDLIRQAEIDGKTSAVVYDDKGDLVPLTNLDYAKASEAFADADQRSILSAYRKAAITTYVSAATTDADTAASEALANNSNNPDGIRASLKGHLAGIESLDPEIYASLAPKATAKFAVAENKALAQQQLETKQNAIATNMKAFNDNATNIAIISAKGPQESGLTKEVLERNVNELLDEQEGIFDALRANEVPEYKIEQLKDLQATVIATKVSVAQIERTFRSPDGGEEAAYRMINTMRTELELDPDVDASQVVQALSSSLSNLIAIDNAASQAQKEMLTGVYNDLYKQIVVDGYNILDSFGNPESQIHELDGTQQGSLMTVGRSSNAQRASIIRAGHDASYANNLAIIKNPEVSSPSEVKRAMSEINLLRGMGHIQPKEYIEAKAEFNKISGFFDKGDVQMAGSRLQVELGPNSSFTNAPEYYQSEMVMSNLEANGVIGEYYKTRKEYLNEIEVYATKYDARKTEIRLANKAEEKLKKNLVPSQAEMSALIKAKDFGKIIMPNGSVEDINLLSDDEQIFELSVNKVSAFALTTKGLLHPEAKPIFEAANRTPENADRAMRIMGQTMSAIRVANPKKSSKQQESIFYQNFDADTVAFLRIADRIGIDAAIAGSTYEKAAQNRDRNYSTILSKRYGDSEDDFFDKTVAEALVKDEFFQFIKPMISDEDNQMLIEMANNAGVSDIEEAFFSDQYIRKGVKDLFIGKLLDQPLYEPKAALLDSLREIGTRIGPQVNPDTGDLEFVRSPILASAQATVPGLRMEDGSVQYDLRITMENIDNDIKNTYLRGSNIVSPELQEQMAMVGTDQKVEGREKPTLHYVANENYGGDQTYSVILKDGYGKPNLINESYSYDFKRTEAYGDNFAASSYTEALTQLNTDRAKQFWSAYGAMDPALLQSTFDRLEKNRNDRSINGLVTAYNKVSSLLGGTAMSIDPLNEQEVDDFFYMIERITSLGWR